MRSDARRLLLFPRPLGKRWTAPLVAHVRMPLHGNAYALFAGAASTSLLGLAYWVLAARTYTAQTVGLQSALLSAMLLLSGISQLSLNTLFIRLLPVSGRNTHRLILMSYGASVAAAMAISTAFVVGTEIWSSALTFLREDPIWFVSFVLATAAWCVFALQDSVLAGMRQAKWVPLENTAVGLGKLVLLVILSSYLPVSGIFVSWNIPVVIAIVLISALIFSRLAPRHERETSSSTNPMGFHHAVRYLGGNYVGSLFNLAAINLVPLIVIAKTDAAFTAYFFLPWTIFISLQYLSMNIAVSLTIESVLDASSVRSYARRALIQNLGILAPLAVGIGVFAPEILRVFGPEYAQAGGTLLRWLAVATIPNTIVLVALALARAMDMSGLVAASQGVLCAIRLGLTFTLVPSSGIEGVGYAVLASQTAVAAFVAVFVMRALALRATAVPPSSSTLPT